MEIQINHHNIDKYLHLQKVLKDILIWVIKELDLPVKTLEVIYTDNEYLQNLHKQYLNQDSKTDVITFELSETEDMVEGEIYISVDQALEQSKTFNVDVESELCRLMIHGCLHLAGYDDTNESQKKEMKILENNLVDKVVKSFYNKLYVEES